MFSRVFSISVLPRGACLIPLIAMILAPFAWIKFLCGCLFIIVARPLWGRSGISAIFLAALFLLAYILSPYWLAVSDYEKAGLSRHMPLTIARLTAFVIIAGLGILWVWLASPTKRHRMLSEKMPSCHLWEPLVPLILGGLLLVYNLLAFYNVVPLHTDEGYHIQRMITVRQAIRSALSGDVLLNDLDHLQTIALRYPLINAWIHQIGLFWESNRFHEAFYRIIPMLSAFSIGYFVMSVLKRSGIHPLTSLLAGASFAITPTVCFYSTILYIEITALVLLLVALYHADTLLTQDFGNTKMHPAWPALMALGFFKETLLIIMVTLVALRLIVRGVVLIRDGRFRPIPLLQETACAFCILLPPLIYIICRTQFAEMSRGYTPKFTNLLSAENWQIAGLALWSQFSLLLIFALLGTAVAICRKKYLFTTIIWTVFVVHFLFHFIGRADLVGYARFQLFLFAPIAVLGVFFIRNLSEYAPKLATAAVVLLLSVHWAMSPVDVFSGGKKPGWAAPANPYYSERYYPVRQAVQWLLKYRPAKKRVLVGVTHPNELGFKWTKIKQRLTPKIKYVSLKRNKRNRKNQYFKNLKKTLKTAVKRKYNLVMIYKTDDTISLSDKETSLLGYRAAKVVANKYQAIVFYEK